MRYKNKRIERVGGGKIRGSIMQKNFAELEHVNQA